MSMPVDRSSNFNVPPTSMYSAQENKAIRDECPVVPQGGKRKELLSRLRMKRQMERNSNVDNLFEYLDDRYADTISKIPNLQAVAKNAIHRYVNDHFSEKNREERLQEEKKFEELLQRDIPRVINSLNHNPIMSIFMPKYRMQIELSLGQLNEDLEKGRKKVIEQLAKADIEENISLASSASTVTANETDVGGESTSSALTTVSIESENTSPNNTTASESEKATPNPIAPPQKKHKKKKKKLSKKLKGKLDEKAPANQPTPEGNQAVTKPPQLVQKTSTLPNIIAKDAFDPSQMALKLYKMKAQYHEHPRIQRWRTANLAQIREFKDMDAEGQSLMHYKNLSDDELKQQRAKHYLPGTERLIMDTGFRKQYAFPTNRGYGMLARFSFNGSTVNGILYLGINDQATLFHKYFEEVEFSSSQKNLLKDDEKSSLAETGINTTDWQSDHNFDVQVMENDVFKFSYADGHSICIYPLHN